MKLIISDTTTPIILAKTKHLNLLSNFVKTVYIPPAVKDELSQKNDGVKEALETGLDLIIDERLGRRYAQSKNINIMGLLGILKINLLNGFISYVELLYMLEEFKEVGFRINPRLEKSFLDSVVGVK